MHINLEFIYIVHRLLSSMQLSHIQQNPTIEHIPYKIISDGLYSIYMYRDHLLVGCMYNIHLLITKLSICRDMYVYRSLVPQTDPVN